MNGYFVEVYDHNKKCTDQMFERATTGEMAVELCKLRCERAIDCNWSVTGNWFKASNPEAAEKVQDLKYHFPEDCEY